MAKGSGSANRALVLGLALLCILALSQPTLATVYNVGGAGGWVLNALKWPLGKHFKAGDVLVFKYNKRLHNVVPVSATGYKTCTKPSGARVYQTGKDAFKLRKGANYFICSLPGHCKAGMKIAVNAA